MDSEEEDARPKRGRTNSAVITEEKEKSSGCCVIL